MYFMAQTWQVLMGHMASAMSTVRNVLFHMCLLQWFFNHMIEGHTVHKDRNNMDHMMMSTTLLPTLIVVVVNSEQSQLGNAQPPW